MRTCWSATEKKTPQTPKWAKNATPTSEFTLQLPAKYKRGSCEVLNGVGVDGVGVFLRIFRFFTHFLPFFAFLRFCSLFSSSPKGQGQTTATYWKNGEFHSDPVCNDPVQNFPTSLGIFLPRGYCGVIVAARQRFTSIGPLGGNPPKIGTFTAWNCTRNRARTP